MCDVYIYIIIRKQSEKFANVLKINEAQILLECVFVNEINENEIGLELINFQFLELW